MHGEAHSLVERIREILEPHRDPERAVGMRRYMRDQFPFLGIPSTERRTVTRATLAAMGKPPEQLVLATARELWGMPEREYQYVAADFLARHRKVLSAEALPAIRELIVTKSWWDTVDALASGVVGALVRRHPELGATMDEWIASENIWLARTAILYQLDYRSDTDADRLFRFCLRRAADQEFFLRKAIGWALRQYSRTDPEAVQAFLQEHSQELSPLSKREAMLWITGRPGTARRTAFEAAVGRPAGAK